MESDNESVRQLQSAVAELRRENGRLQASASAEEDSAFWETVLQRSTTLSRGLRPWEVSCAMKGLRGHASTDDEARCALQTAGFRWDSAGGELPPADAMVLFARRGNLAVCKWLHLKNCTAVHRRGPKGETIFHNACQPDNAVQLLEWLFNDTSAGNHLANTCTDETTALAVAAHCGRLDACMWFEGKMPGMVHAAARNGYTPLHLAAQAGHLDTTEWLLRVGASHTAVDFLGRSPLFLAVRNAHVPICALILEAADDPATAASTADSSGVSMLRVASLHRASRERLLLQQLLVLNGALAGVDGRIDPEILARTFPEAGQQSELLAWAEGLERAHRCFFTGFVVGTLSLDNHRQSAQQQQPRQP